MAEFSRELALLAILLAKLYPNPILFVVMVTAIFP